MSAINPSKNTFPMRVTFHDVSETDYDEVIERTREVMKSCDDPLKSETEMKVAISELERIKRLYYPRPCVEGFCFGLWTPHRSRIERRIEDLTTELNILHAPAAQRFLEEKAQQLSRSEKDKDREMKLKKMRIEEEGRTTRHSMTMDAEKESYRLEKGRHYKGRG